MKSLAFSDVLPFEHHRFGEVPPTSGSCGNSGVTQFHLFNGSLDLVYEFVVSVIES